MDTRRTIRCHDDLPMGFHGMRDTARGEGFRFLDRLDRDWRDGIQRFDAPGETLLAVLRGSDLVAIGGLTVDPYPPDRSTGRIRHVYVRPSARRQGIASELVHQLLDHARGVFPLVRLRTDTAQGVYFYDAVGFGRSSSSTATHEIRP
ncbi:GNAT family N-acetyltransferase [Maritimibacter dapengensis]|uniref:GNAT family N-acetyltransferase n=1 Tax=Maritimibacter dapengensis TaxID=2836868 RepID=A0ABS6T1P0_9RHOB|nr:GNAT family N-acetyltransferase [Maritimibacter dapengensis]MBV7378648.1 GNAT family N-acetyltransferase [Maritimibacter dapengensis]